jgi:hypothetical protein
MPATGPNCNSQTHQILCENSPAPPKQSIARALKKRADIVRGEMDFCVEQIDFHSKAALAFADELAALAQLRRDLSAPLLSTALRELRDRLLANAPMTINGSE